MPRLSISLLGPKVILLDGKPARAFTYQKAMALLAFLAVEASVPHSRQILVGLLWPDLANAAALTNLRQVLADLRQVIGDEDASPPFLLTTRESIQFNAESDYQLDTATFLHAISSCDSHRHRHIDRCRLCQARSAVAIELYRGDFLSGFSVDDADPFEEWVTLRREELHERARQLLANLANYQLRNRNDERAHHYLRRQVELEPWQEEAHQQLMRLYARNGQRSSALVQFEQCQRILAAELGVEPSPQTKKLYAQIRDGAPLEEEANAQQRNWHNLPLSATSLVGRGGELAQLGELLSDPAHRLITILGPGGIGKTRLALAAAAENAVGFGNGVLFVSLAGMNDARFLPNAILSALETPLAPEQTPQEQLLAVLRGQELLLILDNYEQFLPNVELLNHLLRSARGVTLLVTSRQRLAMQAEHLHEVSGLDHPHSITDGTSIAVLEQYSALQLFIQRARQVQHNFAPTLSDTTAILRIGRITQGMPLALELAAAAVRVQSCEAIATALESGQQVLSTQMRDLPERQRSMQAVFAHSMRLLSAEEYRVFCALALFHGGFTAEAAEEVAAVQPPMLATLIDKSLLRASSTYRYEMHELIRQFAGTELAQRPEARTGLQERHSRYYLHWLQLQAPHPMSAHQHRAIAPIEVDFENIRAAWLWVVENQDFATLMLSLDGLCHLCRIRGRTHEGVTLLRQAAEALQSVPQVEADAQRVQWLGQILACIGALYTDIRDPEHAIPILEQSLALLDEPRSRAFVLACLGYAISLRGEDTRAEAWLHESLVICREYDDAQGQAYALYRLSIVHWAQAEYPRSIETGRQALSIYRALGRLDETAHVLSDLAGVECWSGEYGLAFAHAQESFEICRGSGYRHGEAWALNTLGFIAWCRDEELEEAAARIHGALVIYRNTGHDAGTSLCLTDLALLANARGQHQQAVQFGQESVALARTLRNNHILSDTLTFLGCAQIGNGELLAARHSLQESWMLARSSNNIFTLINDLYYLAELLIKESRVNHGNSAVAAQCQALEWLVFLQHHPGSWQVYKQKAARLQNEIEGTISTHQFVAAQKRGRTLKLSEIAPFALQQPESTHHHRPALSNAA